MYTPPPQIPLVPHAAHMSVKTRTPRYAVVHGMVVPDAPPTWTVGQHGCVNDTDVLRRTMTDLCGADFKDVIEDAPGRIVTDSHGSNPNNEGIAGVIDSMWEAPNAAGDGTNLYALVYLDRNRPAGAGLVYALEHPESGLVRGMSISMCSRVAPSGQIERVVRDVALCERPRRAGTSARILYDTDDPPVEMRRVPDWVFDAVSEAAYCRQLEATPSVAPVHSVYCILDGQKSDARY